MEDEESMEKMTEKTAQKITEIAEGCSYIKGKGFCSNIYILHDSKVTILIDAGDGSIDLNVVPDIAILTHGHFDHTSGVKEGWNAFLRKEDFINTFPYHPPKGVKRLNFSRKKIGSFDLEIIRTPGHTPGSVSIYERTRKILFTGDLIFSDGWVGRTDLLGGSDEALQSSLRKILSRFSTDISPNSPTIPPLKLKLGIYALCPGHGDVKIYVGK